jgi:hypothetical protein
MGLLRTVDNSPGALAEELAAAKAAWQEKRQSVIDRAVARQQAIAETQAELAAEQTALEGVVKDA